MTQTHSVGQHLSNEKYTQKLLVYVADEGLRDGAIRNYLSSKLAIL